MHKVFSAGWLTFFGIAFLLSGCAPATTPSFSSSTPPLISSPSPSSTPSPFPSATSAPTFARPPTKTTRPSPTIPSNETMACIPMDTDRLTGLVNNIIDGDTIEVSVQGLTFRVRYLGIDTPEISLPVDRMGPEAVDRNRELVRGKRVTLIRDTEADNTDRYDRLLRYVLIDDIFVNYQLVREGLAHYTTFPNACSGAIFQAEEAARADNLGLWSDD